MILSNAAGDLGLYQLYKVGFEFDKLLHFVNSLLCAAVVPVILNKRFGINFARAVLISFLAVVIGGLIWEIYEYGVDLIWETHIAGIYGLNVKDDTIRDLIPNAAGALIGALIVYVRPFDFLGKIK
jgi:VanZ family protein